MYVVTVYFVASRQVARVFWELTTTLDVGIVSVRFRVTLADAYATFLASLVVGMTCLIRVAFETSIGEIDSLVRNVIGVRMVMPGVSGKLIAIMVTMASTSATCRLRKCGECTVLQAKFVSRDLKVHAVSSMLAREAVLRLRVKVMAIILNELKTFFMNRNVRNRNGTLGRSMASWLICSACLRVGGLACCRGQSRFVLITISIM